MSAAQIAQTRIKELEQQLAETQIAAEGFRAQLMQTRDEMITARHASQGREQGWRLQLAEVLGAEVMEVREGIQALAAQYRKLLDGYPDGMTPTDVEKLKAANAGLAAQNELLREGIEEAAVANTKVEACEIAERYLEQTTAQSLDDIQKAAAKKAYWHGFETAHCFPDETNILRCWTEYDEKIRTKADQPITNPAETSSELVMGDSNSPLACWSCSKPVTECAVSEADGNCPHCGVEIDEEQQP